MTQKDDEFAEFVRNRSPALLRTAYLLCGGDQHAAEDLLQDVLERMYPRWRRINTTPESYARAALANAAANRWRRRSRRATESPLEEAANRSVTGPEPGVVNRDLIVRALGELSPKLRVVLVLRYFDDISEAETATALGLRAGTVKSRTSRALTKLREVLNGEAAPFPPSVRVPPRRHEVVVNGY